MKTYYSKQIYLKDKVLDGYLIVDDNGIIVKVDSDYKGNDFADLSDYILIPGIIDTHNHGSHGYNLFGEVDNPEATIKGYLKGIASTGVTSVLPTAGIDFFESLSKVAKEHPKGAEIVGIHSEGPFLSRVGEKGIKEEPVPVDLNVIQSMIDKGDGLLKLVAIAPELPNAQAGIDLLVKNNIKVAFAHSYMNYSEAYEAFDNGVSIATHTANVMAGIHHREMGGLGACLLHADVDCELIADGLHVSTEMMELMFRVKDFDKWMLISDSISAAGAPVGRYKTGRFTVNIDEQGFAKTDTGRLMGSTKPVIFGMSVLSKQLNISLKDLVKMSSFNPAKVYGLKNKGSIAVKKDADFVAIDEKFNVIKTFVKGVEVYSNDSDEKLFNPDYLSQKEI